MQTNVAVTRDHDEREERHGPTLDGLISGIEPGNVRSEADWGGSVGNEVW